MGCKNQKSKHRPVINFLRLYTGLLRPTLAGPVRWQYWPLKGPARHSDVLPAQTRISTFLGQQSIETRQILLECYPPVPKKQANSCHTIENKWFAWKGNRDHNISLQTWSEQCGWEWWGYTQHTIFWPRDVIDDVTRYLQCRGFIRTTAGGSPWFTCTYMAYSKQSSMDIRHTSQRILYICDVLHICIHILCSSGLKYKLNISKISNMISRHQLPFTVTAI
jgi:hypothetical protein